MRPALSRQQERSFWHGVHPEPYKEQTNHLAIARMPFVSEYVLPLSQHIGVPSTPVVEPGARVQRGQLIAGPSGFVSVGLHSPVTGRVEAIELRPHPGGGRLPAIVLRTDPYDSQRLIARVPLAADDLGRDQWIACIQEAGLVGLGGAAFPTHVKLKVPEGKSVRSVILNGCECEPYLTCDHRLMLENPEKVIRGLRLSMKVAGAPRGYIGVENNKADAIAALRVAAGQDPDIEVVSLAVKYPQGAEKMLIDAILHREVAPGGLPIDLNILVHNVGSAIALVDLVDEGKPLIERVVTVAGPGIRRPANLLVPVGTSVKAVVDYCGGLLPDTHSVVLGGPMMGLAQSSLDIPVLKGTSGILALTSPVVHPDQEQPCIRCGRCLTACPLFLNPSRLAHLVRAEMIDQLLAHQVLSCFECACCSYVCPSHIPLVQLLRMGKALVRQKKGS